MPLELEEGRELESALCAVDPSTYIALLDRVREDQKNLRLFITHLAKTDPRTFERVAGEIFSLPEWEAIDEYIKNNEKIKAIKLVREVTGKGLREAKALVDRRIPGTPPPIF